MTPKQKRFVEEYRHLRNASEAARRAGYSARHCGAIGAQQLRKPPIVAALKALGVDIVLGLRPPGQVRRTPRRTRTELTVKEQRFVEEYLIDGSAKNAAIRTQMKTRRPEKAGSHMLRRKRVAEAIARERLASAERTRISHDRILTEFARIAFAEIGDIAEWDEDGLRLKPARQMSKHDRAAVSEITSRQGKKGARMRVRMHSKLKALDALAKLLGMWGKGARVIAETAENAAEAEKKRRAGDEARRVLRERILRLVHGPGATLPARSEPEPDEEPEEE